MLFKWAMPISVSVWDSEMVIYHHQSGDTYCFSDVAKNILTVCLSRESFNDSDLLEIANDFFEDRRQVEPFVRSLKQSLVQKDLVIAETL